jgi:hypothetical protein
MYLYLIIYAALKTSGYPPAFSMDCRVMYCVIVLFCVHTPVSA